MPNRPTTCLLALLTGRGRSTPAISVAIATMVLAYTMCMPPASVAAPQHTVFSRTPQGEIAAVASTWAAAYRDSRWSQVLATFTSPSAARALVGRMQRWQRSGAVDLTITPTYVLKTRTGYLVTIRFSGDARAVPAYGLYTFTTAPGRAVVTGVAAGITGSDYRHAGWAITRSKHFIVYHSPLELQGSDMKYIAGLEQQWTSIQSRFKVHLPLLANYYLYPDTATMARLTARSCGASADNVGCTNPFTSPPTIQTSLWPTYHEPIHVYQIAFQPRPVGNDVRVAPLFIAEGMAVALEERNADPRLSDYCSTLVYIPLDACARIGIVKTRPASLLTDADFKRSNLGNAYALAGSFVKYLILKYGYVPFGKFYYALAAQPKDRVSDYNVATKAIYHTTIAALLGAWQRALCSSCGR